MHLDDFGWDLESYPNCFTFSILRVDGSLDRTFEISFRKNEVDKILICLDYLHTTKKRMIGFNSLGFDYPVIHKLLEMRDNLPSKGITLARKLWKIVEVQIASMRGDFTKTVPLAEHYVTQIDLFKIHHFDNKAKMTSLKMLEFNMKSANIEDLPYHVGKELTSEEIDVLIVYNKHDVRMTIDFYFHSIKMIDFREELTNKYNRNFLNHNDTKIGKDYFIMKLEEEKVPVYKFKDGKRVINQTKRSVIEIDKCLFDYYDFKRPEFVAVKNWFATQKITETKGVFSELEEHTLGEVAKYADMRVKKLKFKTKPSDTELQAFKKLHPMGWVETEDLKATEYLLDSNGDVVLEYPTDESGNIDFTKKQKKVRVPKKSYWGCWNIAETLNVIVDGFRFDFGTGGIHGSIENKIAKENKKYQIIDADVSSMYPNIAIANKVYPLHLTNKFCEIYEDVYEQRKSYPKGSAENAMLKLALNGVYGDSNNQYSPFYDPLYTMSITINGQLSLCLLAEKLLDIKDLKIIQVNTDGITVALPRDGKSQYDKICEDWQKQVGLHLEYADYSKMIIRDVNNYIAIYTNGKVKRKGAYQYEDLGWHQNHSALVVQMAVEAEMVQRIPISEFIQNHAKNPNNKWDFMLRTKVPRSSKLYMIMEDGTEIQQQNICRYYPCETGGKLVKVMPPLEEGGELRRLSLDKEWNVKTCNNIEDFGSDIDLDYYISEAEKLLIKV